jgi:hypothetical protein
VTGLLFGLVLLVGFVLLSMVAAAGLLVWFYRRNRSTVDPAVKKAIAAELDQICRRKQLATAKRDLFEADGYTIND